MPIVKKQQPNNYQNLATNPSNLIRDLKKQLELRPERLKPPAKLTLSSNGNNKPRVSFQPATSKNEVSHQYANFSDNKPIVPPKPVRVPPPIPARTSQGSVPPPIPARTVSLKKEEPDNSGGAQQKNPPVVARKPVGILRTTSVFIEDSVQTKDVIIKEKPAKPVSSKEHNKFRLKFNRLEAERNNILERLEAINDELILRKFHRFHRLGEPAEFQTKLDEISNELDAWEKKNQWKEIDQINEELLEDEDERNDKLAGREPTKSRALANEAKALEPKKRSRLGSFFAWLFRRR